MNVLLKNYKTLLLGLATTVGLFFILTLIDFIRIEPTAIVENIFIFGFWWMAFSFLIYKIPYFKKNMHVVYKVIGLLALFIIIIALESNSSTPDNPITFPLFILFWIGVTYLVLPDFFKKYKLVIFSVYGLALSYFLYTRMSDNYFEEHKQHVINFLLIPIPVFISLWIYEQWRWMKSLQAEKGKAELALLKSQINPHFFFNTLNNLYGLVVEKSEKAPEVVLKLSDMMRYTIYEGKEDLVSLNEEIAYLESYIDLHKIRYQKKVEISFTKNVEKEYRVAPLLFIILLENAFKHGVERITKDAYIDIDLTAEGNQICFSIENNFEQEEKNNVVGIGLENLKKRLEHTYPNQYELSIEKDVCTYKATLTIIVA